MLIRILRLLEECGWTTSTESSTACPSSLSQIHGRETRRQLSSRGCPLPCGNTKFKGRDAMLPWALTLQSSLQAAQFCGPLAINEEEDDLTKICVLCKAASDVVDTAVFGREHGVFRCARCVSLWHARCATYVAGLDDDAGEVHFEINCFGCRGRT